MATFVTNIPVNMFTDFDCTMNLEDVPEGDLISAAASLLRYEFIDDAMHFTGTFVVTGTDIVSGTITKIALKDTANINSTTKVEFTNVALTVAQIENNVIVTEGDAEFIFGEDMIEYTLRLADTITGSAHNDVGHGGYGDDVLNLGTGDDTGIGAQHDDTLNGAAGNDSLYGKGDNDILQGGEGADRFVFDTALNAATNTDAIADFSSGTDKLVLSKSVFTAASLLVGTLKPGQFVAGDGAVALDANDRIIVDTATGNIYYDSNGNAAGGRTLFATLDEEAHIVASDILIVA